MKQKDMRRSDWRRILKRTYTDCDFYVDGIQAKKSLLQILEVTQPLVIENIAGRIAIADRGHSWVQIAVKAQHVWITAMFNADGEFLQAYFDITAGNCFDHPENPTFTDMYLDVVLTKQGSVYILDQNELDDALKDRLITSSEHTQALAHCTALCAYLRAHSTEFIHYCQKTYQELLIKT